MAVGRGEDDGEEIWECRMIPGPDERQHRSVRTLSFRLPVDSRLIKGMPEETDGNDGWEELSVLSCSGKGRLSSRTRYQRSGFRISRNGSGDRVAADVTTNPSLRHRVRDEDTARPSIPSFPRKRESTADRKMSVPDGGSCRTLDIGLDSL